MKLHRFQNGLQLLLLPLPDVEYIAFRLLVPGAVINDSVHHQGLSLLLAEMTSRGVGDLDSRALAIEFDKNGIRHGESASLLHYGYHASFLPDKMNTAIELMYSLVTKPHLNESSLDPVRSLFLQDLAALSENPSRLAINELRKRIFPEPYNRPSCGTLAGLKAITIDDIKSEYSERYGADGSIISLAGKFDEEECISTLEKSFGEWQGKTREIPSLGDFPECEPVYLHAPGAQQQLVLSYRSAPHEDKHYYPTKVLTQILSGGMFGRLFIEVREKRGLCYSVFAQHSARKEYGLTTVYAGTTPERVDQTLEVIGEVLKDPIKDLGSDELDRAKYNLISQLVLSSESTSAQANMNASDFILLGKIRGLDEIKNAIMSVTKSDLVSALEAYPFTNATQLTLGERNFGEWAKGEYLSGHQ